MGQNQMSFAVEDHERKLSAHLGWVVSSLSPLRVGPIANCKSHFLSLLKTMIYFTVRFECAKHFELHKLDDSRRATPLSSFTLPKNSY